MLSKVQWQINKKSGYTYGYMVKSSKDLGNICVIGGLYLLPQLTFLS